MNDTISTLRLRMGPASICILCIISTVFTQASVGERVDEFVKAEMSKQKVPGVSLAVVKDGKPFIVKGYGFSDLEHQVPVKPETVFQSGSVGKQFTATATMLLVEDGRINLDEKISKYLGEVPESWKDITVRHLLSHTGGMTDYPQDFDFRRDYSEDDILRKAKEIPVAFKPGENWQYSNLGYVTLGILIGKVTGKFYGEFMQDRIFKPLGMTTARIISEADIIPNRASGYILVAGQVKNQGWVSPSMNTTADGSLYLTALDMIKWDDALANGKILKKSSLDEMWTPIKLNNGATHPYGFGWALRTVNGHRVIEHGGAWQGFKSHIARFPENKLTVIVFANLNLTNQAKIANGVAAIVDSELRPKPIVDPDPDHTAQTKALLESVLGGKGDLTRFTPAVQKAISDQQDRLLAFVKTLGVLQSFKLLERIETAGGTAYRYQVEYTGMNLFLSMTVNKDGKISNFALQPE